MADTTYDSNVYCDFAEASAKAGKDILLCIWNTDGTKLLAISGQQSLTINRSADTLEVTSKDTQGGWKSQISGMKEWSIDNDGIYMNGAESDLVCLKVVDAKDKKPLFGGLACITDYTLEAPYDDSMTYSLSFSGNGPLVDLTALESADAAKVTAMPE